MPKKKPTDQPEQKTRENPSLVRSIWEIRYAALTGLRVTIGEWETLLSREKSMWEDLPRMRKSTPDIGETGDMIYEESPFYKVALQYAGRESWVQIVTHLPSGAKNEFKFRPGYDPIITDEQEKERAKIFCEQVDQIKKMIGVRGYRADKVIYDELTNVVSARPFRVSMDGIPLDKAATYDWTAISFVDARTGSLPPFKQFKEKMENTFYSMTIDDVYIIGSLAVFQINKYSRDTAVVVYDSVRLAVECKECNRMGMVRCAHIDYVGEVLSSNKATEIALFIGGKSGKTLSPEYIGQMQRVFGGLRRRKVEGIPLEKAVTYDWSKWDNSTEGKEALLSSEFYKYIKEELDSIVIAEKDETLDLAGKPERKAPPPKLSEWKLIDLDEA